MKEKPNFEHNVVNFMQVDIHRGSSYELWVDLIFQCLTFCGAQPLFLSNSPTLCIKSMITMKPSNCGSDMNLINIRYAPTDAIYEPILKTMVVVSGEPQQIEMVWSSIRTTAKYRTNWRLFSSFNGVV